MFIRAALLLAALFSTSAFAGPLPSEVCNANTVVAGPSTGAAKAPACRALVAADVPASLVTSPGGRLLPCASLACNTPIPIATVTGATNVAYDTDSSNYAFVYNGSGWTQLTITADEISMGLSATNHLSGKLYDFVLINNSGTLTLCTLPAWTNTTTRSAAIVKQNGLWTNTASAAHCFGGVAGATDYGTVAANQGSYVGTCYMTGNGQTSYQYTVAGSAATIGCYNAYNKKPITVTMTDTANTSTTTSVTGCNATADFVRWVDGLQQSSITGTVNVSAEVNSGDAGVAQVVSAYVTLDNSHATTFKMEAFNTLTASDLYFPIPVTGAYAPQLGLHGIYCEQNSTSTASSILIAIVSATINM